MQQTVSSEQQKTREQHPRAGADYSDSFPGKEALEERSLRYVPPSGGFLGVAYERFLQLPVPVVLAVLWLAGMALLTSCVLILYMVGTWSASLVAGV